MDYYDYSCKVDELQGKIECFVELLVTLASVDSDDQASGTFWFIKDTVKGYCQELESLSDELMENHRELTDQTTSLKPKKNADKTKNK
jgi:hypothetical protein